MVSGLYVCEMVIVCVFIEWYLVIMYMIMFFVDELLCLLQLYIVDLDIMYVVVWMIVGEGLVDYIDMNFGCLVFKVIKCGGGVVLLFKWWLFGQIVVVVVCVIEGIDILVMVKFCIGIDDVYYIYLDVGCIVEVEGVVVVVLYVCIVV